MFGSWSGEKKMSRGVDMLKGATVQTITLEGALPELRIEMDGGRALQSFTTVEGQPEWCLFLEDGSWLSVARGVVKLEQPAGRKAPAAAGGLRRRSWLRWRRRS
jgi:hypothetical protein